MTITINEIVEPLFPSGTGADPIFVAGNCGYTKDTGKVLFFSNYYDAKKPVADGGIGPEPEDWTTNPVLACLRNIFSEGAVRKAGEKGVDKVYVVNMGSAPTQEDWQAVFETAEQVQTKIEAYPGVKGYTIPGEPPVEVPIPGVFDQIGDHMDALETKMNYRNAFASLPGELSIVDMQKYTDPTQTSFVRNSRVHLEINPEMLGTYVAKVAYTPYHQDPALGTYRSKTIDDIKIALGAGAEPRLLKTEEVEALKDSGLVVDVPSFVEPGLVEPYRAVSTGYRLATDNTRPTDSKLHIRRNVDHQWEELDIITYKMFKMNNTAVVRGMIEGMGNAYLQGESDKGYLIPDPVTPTDPGYLFEVEVDPDNAFKLHRRRKVRPVGSVDMIEDISVVQVPIGGE